MKKISLCWSFEFRTLNARPPRHGRAEPHEVTRPYEQTAHRYERRHSNLYTGIVQESIRQESTCTWVTDKNSLQERQIEKRIPNTLARRKPRDLYTQINANPRAPHRSASARSGATAALYRMELIYFEFNHSLISNLISTETQHATPQVSLPPVTAPIRIRQNCENACSKNRENLL